MDAGTTLPEQVMWLTGENMTTLPAINVLGYEHTLLGWAALAFDGDNVRAEYAEFVSQYGCIFWHCIDEVRTAVPDIVYVHIVDGCCLINSRADDVRNSLEQLSDEDVWDIIAGTETNSTIVACDLADIWNRAMVKLGYKPPK